eukprot:GILK01003447.1.p1 GENE.GILK01003447.1~~GILK01003447.1.p1  ORF type:complete len:851 (-),score=109.24 GILK01003447.1:182-2734(-)
MEVLMGALQRCVSAPSQENVDQALELLYVEEADLDRVTTVLEAIPNLLKPAVINVTAGSYSLNADEPNLITNLVRFVSDWLYADEENVKQSYSRLTLPLLALGNLTDKSLVKRLLGCEENLLTYVTSFLSGNDEDFNRVFTAVYLPYLDVATPKPEVLDQIFQSLYDKSCASPVTTVEIAISVLKKLDVQLEKSSTSNAVRKAQQDRYNQVVSGFESVLSSDKQVFYKISSVVLNNMTTAMPCEWAAGYITEPVSKWLQACKGEEKKRLVTTVCDTLDAMMRQPMGSNDVHNRLSWPLVEPLNEQLVDEDCAGIILPLLFRACSLKDSFIGTRAAIGISNLAKTKPKFLASSGDALFESLQKNPSSASLAAAAQSIAKHRPDIFLQPDNLGTIVDLILNPEAETSSAPLFLMILQDACSRDATSLVPSITKIIELVVDTNLGSAPFAVHLIKSIAEINPHVLYPLFPDLERRYIDLSMPTLDSVWVGILGRLSRISNEVAAEMVEKLADKLTASRDDSTKCLTIIELRSIAQMDKKLVARLKDTLKSMEASASSMVQPGLMDLVNVLEGKDVRSLAQCLEEQNEAVKLACGDFEAVKAYIDANIAQVKEFMADVVKKLPSPLGVSAKNEFVVRRVVELHFGCCQHKDGICSYPGGGYERVFRTQSKDWNKWLKAGVGLVKLGKSVMAWDAAGAACELLATAQSLYSAYKTRDDDDFNTFIREPFLTSTEQDKLINQLREAHFFDAFTYDAQMGDWVCNACRGIPEPAGAKSKKDAKKTRNAETKPDMPAQASSTKTECAQQQIPSRQAPALEVAQPPSIFVQQQSESPNHPQAAMEIQKPPPQSACCLLQ